MGKIAWITLGIVVVTVTLGIVFPKESIQESPIPKDIQKKIEVLYPDEQERAAVLKICNRIMDLNLNVGPDQLIRSMLIIAGSDLNKLQEIVDSNFYGDPRDVIMTAMKVPGNTNDHGMTAFDEN